MYETIIHTTRILAEVSCSSSAYRNLVINGYTYKLSIFSRGERAEDGGVFIVTRNDLMANRTLACLKTSRADSVRRKGGRMIRE
jgi:hypothetical protein